MSVTTPPTPTTVTFGNPSPQIQQTQSDGSTIAVTWIYGLQTFSTTDQLIVSPIVTS